MKKVLFIVMMAVATIGSASAVDIAKSEVFVKCNNERVFNSLVKYLEADSYQSAQLKEVFAVTEVAIKNAIQKGDSEKLEKAFSYNLGGAKRILSKDQYKKYLRVINLSYHNSNAALLAQNNQ